MTVPDRIFRDAYRVAHAAGWDAGNRRAAGEGRGDWNAADLDHAAATFQSVIAALGFGDPASQAEPLPVTVLPGLVPQPRTAPHGQPALLRRQPRHPARARPH